MRYSFLKKLVTYSVLLTTISSWAKGSEPKNVTTTPAIEQCRYFTEYKYDDPYFVNQLQKMEGDEILYPLNPIKDKNGKIKSPVILTVNDVIKYKDETKNWNLKSNAEQFKRRLKRLAIYNGINQKAYYYAAFPYLAREANERNNYDPYQGTDKLENELNNCLKASPTLDVVYERNNEVIKKISPEDFTRKDRAHIAPFITDLLVNAILAENLHDKYEELKTKISNVETEISSYENKKNQHGRITGALLSYLTGRSKKADINEILQRKDELLLEQQLLMDSYSYLYQDQPLLFNIENEANILDFEFIHMRYTRSNIARIILRHFDGATLDYLKAQFAQQNSEQLETNMPKIINHYKDYLQKLVASLTKDEASLQGLKRNVADKINETNRSLIKLCSTRKSTVDGERDLHKLHLHPDLVNYAFKRLTYPVQYQKVRFEARSQSHSEIDPAKVRASTLEKSKIQIMRDFGGYCHLMQTEPPEEDSFWNWKTVTASVIGLLGVALIPVGVGIWTLGAFGLASSALFSMNYAQNIGYYNARLNESQILVASAIENSEALLHINEKLMEFKTELGAELATIGTMNAGSKYKAIKSIKSKVESYKMSVQEELYDYSVMSKYKRYRTALNKGQLNQAILDNYDFKRYFRKYKERQEFLQSEAAQNQDLLEKFKYKTSVQAAKNHSGNEVVSPSLANDPNKANIPSFLRAYFTVGDRANSRMAAVTTITHDTSSANGIKALGVVRESLDDVFHGLQKIERLMREGMEAGKQSDELNAFLKGKTLLTGGPTRKFYQQGANGKVIKINLSVLDENGNWIQKTVNFTSADEVIGYYKKQKKLFKETFAHTGMDEIMHASKIEDQMLLNAENYYIMQILRDEFQRNIGELSRNETLTIVRYYNPNSTGPYAAKLQNIIGDLRQKGLNSEQIDVYLKMQVALNNPRYQPRIDAILRLDYEMYKSEKNLYKLSKKTRERILEKADVAFSAAFKTNITSATRIAKIVGWFVDRIKNHKFIAFALSGSIIGGSSAALYNTYVRGSSFDAGMAELNIWGRNLNRKYIGGGNSGAEKDCAQKLALAGRNFSFENSCFMDLLQLEVSVEFARTYDDESYHWRNDHTVLRKIEDYATRMVKLRNTYHAAALYNTGVDALQRAYMWTGLNQILDHIQFIEKNDNYVRAFAINVMSAETQEDALKAVERMRQEKYSETAVRLAYLGFDRKNEIKDSIQNTGKLPIDIFNMLGGNNAISAITKAESTLAGKTLEEITTAIIKDVQNKIEITGLEEQIKNLAPGNSGVTNTQQEEENQLVEEIEQENAKTAIDMILNDE